MHDWETDVTIPAPHGAGVCPLPLNRIRYTPAGLYDIRRHCGALPHSPGAYNTHRQSFEAADMAWIATSLGLSTRPLQLMPSEFPPELLTLRDGMPANAAPARAAMRARLQRLIFDVAALLDRAFGGATLVLHVEGSTRPNSPLRPEYVKSDVYFPAHLIEEEPRLSPILSSMAQQFMVDVGLSVIERWERCARVKWSFTQGADGKIPAPYVVLPEQPIATPPGSSSFIYHGREVNTVGARPHVTVNGDSDDEDDTFSQFDPSPSEWQVIEAAEKYARLESQLAAMRDELMETKKALSEALVRECNHAAELDAARAHGGRPTVAFALQPSPSPHTSLTSPSRRTYPSPLRGPVTPRKATSPGNPVTPLSRQSANHPSRPGTPACEGPSRVQGGATVNSFDSFAGYDDFLLFHGMSHFSATLDFIRNNCTVSSWPEHLGNLKVPKEKVDPLIKLMLKAYSG
ncbi:hypothetical protein GALMADRAFT_140966 [Galerina marginata CBS 339.88]|uniref:Uncharacterized protein n=1 Tax=Galerina marginata (strain CBS 339.88) TaxID=685588 RepID=A0A067SUJ2_GALM3|nr:hypothetical protein GALMADRAFT_140966 [Galerina marginata CBS 339.88]